MCEVRARGAMAEYSVVIPVHNEAHGIANLLREVRAVLAGLGVPYEIIVVDDGSTDTTWTLVQEAAKAGDVFGYRLNRNFGQQAAICAGLAKARGNAIAIMDGDGQDPPEVLRALFDKWQKGCDVAYGVRRGRKEGFLRRACYYAFYRILGYLADTPIPADSGDFAVIDRKVAEFILSINDRAPFIRGLRGWYGGRQESVPYDRPARRTGRTNWSWFAMIGFAVNGITSFSKVPLRLAIYMGGSIAMAAFAFGTFIVVRKLAFGAVPAGGSQGWTSLATLVAFLGGLNLFMLGVVGEYIAHIFDAAKRFPVYLIAESTSRETD
ncbi:MAG TPA: glycosyltransferase family 2 protein [Candidatus Hydrogenedentes bacterium]|nr:glycosyltransferase family 2 protein [Candidatus Hydrogenedentota bacterium]HRT20751.1 glycosyltransferase family 2 protein [Candidatus Hydrogenedentota bacterium]HRT66753.1 glycosyltransferase family 2 protein [Candidatus Hydrogenedentota bacterium]